MIKSGRDLEAMDLKHLLARLHHDEVRAWQEYDKLRRKLVMFFEPHLEAPELAEEVLDRIARKSESINNIVEFAFGVARNLRKETFHGALHVVHLEDEQELASKDGDPERDFLVASDAACKRECLKQCLQQLSLSDRKLILSYYPPDDEDLEQRRRQLAEETGMNWGALRTRVVRLRSRLAECCSQRYLRTLCKSAMRRESSGIIREKH